MIEIINDIILPDNSHNYDIVINDIDIVENYESQHRDFDNDDYYRNNTYHIGLFSYDYEKLLLASSVTINTFMKFKFEKILNFLNNWSLNMNTSFNKIEIMKICIENKNTINETLYVTLKTFWIRLIQRNWRRILKQRAQFISSIKLHDYLQKRQLGLNVPKIPRLFGMLSHLKNK